MQALSDRTIGLMIDAAGHYASTTGELAAMLRRCDLARYGNVNTAADKTEMLTSALLSARDQVEHADNRQAHRSLLDFICLVVEKAFRNPVFAPRWLDELEKDLLADGYQMRWQIGCAPDDDARVDLLPTDAAPVPLAAEITALEAELNARGYATVLDHYQQAVDGFTHHKYESANGDLRTALEDLIVRLAEDQAGYPRQPKASQGGEAITHLIQGGHLPADDGGLMLRGLWKLSCTNGPHPGQSDTDEARFRLQVITATARFLLKHFSADT